MGKINPVWIVYAVVFLLVIRLLNIKPKTHKVVI